MQLLASKGDSLFSTTRTSYTNRSERSADKPQHLSRKAQALAKHFDLLGLSKSKYFGGWNPFEGPFGPLCGSGGQATYIPDELFTQPCVWHDWCYGYGGKKAGFSKTRYDLGFFDRMQKSASS